QLLKQKNHGLRASLRFALRPWFQDSHRKWYNYRGQVNPTRKISLTDPETVRYPTEEEAFEAAFAFGKAAIESF
ncbi:MAG: hypothetical protein QF919_06300, partial [Nitrospinota bacterium]|nr:hypothetical protein [Nitrospinota bacterium]